MKDNKDFLEGVYRKAELLEKENLENRIPYKKYIRYSSVAAIFIILPLLFFGGKIMTPYEDIARHQPRMMNYNDPISNFSNSDFILIGEVKEIKESIYVEERSYIYTDILILVDKVFLGEVGEEEIRVRVNGGKVEKERVFSEIEGEFNIGNRSLMFLYKDEEDIYYLANNPNSQFKEIEKDIFIDEFGNKYNLEAIKKNINER